MEDEKNLTPEQQAAQQQAAQPEEKTTEQPVSARDRYRSRYAEEYPDLNLDDEEALYGQANNNLDELNRFRQSNKELGEAMDKAPILGGLILAAKAGQNPYAYLVENIGPDMDIRDLADNPEFAAQMGEALKKFQERQEKAQAKEKEIGENMAKSLQVLKEYQAEKGLTDEECVKMIADFIGDYDEAGEPVEKPSFMQNASNGIITKGMWEALFNARHYADDITAAEEKARATALNEKIQNKVKTFGDGVPTLTGGNGGGETVPKPRKGGFKDWGEDL